MAENAAKVEQFLLLAKSAKGLALVDLITKCTSEPGLFTFGEILSLPGVQEVRPVGRAWPARCSLPPLLPPTSRLPACSWKGASMRQHTTCYSCSHMARGKTIEVRAMHAQAGPSRPCLVRRQNTIPRLRLPVHCWLAVH